MKTVERIRRAKEYAARRAERRKPKPIETIINDGELQVIYDPNRAIVRIVYGVADIELPEVEAIVMRDALIDRLA